jgi:photosystem II stability/assembly factor-like uncharacterized protein
VIHRLALIALVALAGCGDTNAPAAPQLAVPWGWIRTATRGSTGGEPQAIAVDGDEKLYVALIDGTVTVSDDGGRTFSEQVAGG